MGMVNNMANQEIRDEFKKLVIMENYPECEDYEEALEEDQGKGKFVSAGERYPKNISEYPIMQRGPVQPITIGRVMNALSNKENTSRINKGFSRYDVFHQSFEFQYDDSGDPDMKYFIEWTLQTPDGREATDDDQDIETIKALLEVLR